MRLRTLARLPLAENLSGSGSPRDWPGDFFRFRPPHDGWEALILCASEDRCDLLQAVPLLAGGGIDDWSGLREWLLRMRRYEFDHTVMGRPSPTKDGLELAANGSNHPMRCRSRRTSVWPKRSPSTSTVPVDGCSYNEAIRSRVVLPERQVGAEHQPALGIPDLPRQGGENGA